MCQEEIQSPKKSINLFWEVSMLDDVAEKARRNLMAVSSGIVAVWALGIPLDGKLVGAVDLGAVEPWRAWVAATCVLAYFAARYHLAPSTTKEWEPWRVRRTKDVSTQLRKTFQDAFNLVPEATRTRIRVTWQDMRGADELTYSINEPTGPLRRRGQFTYAWHYSSFRHKDSGLTLPDGTPCPTPALQGEFCFSRRYYFACQWRAIRAAYKPSWQLLELSFPWALAFGAAAVCFWRLGVSLYYSFPFVRQLLTA